MLEDLELYLVAADGNEDSSGDQMPMPTDALPMALFYEGFDVWLDGNRGTLYQTENTVYNRKQKEYWAFNGRDMALEDQVAQIDFITEQTGKEQVSYLAYSAGTRQMYYLIGLAGEGNEVAQTTLDKVDKFVSLAVCPWADSMEGDIDMNRQAILPVLNMYRNSGLNYLYGQGFNPMIAVSLSCGAAPHDPVCAEKAKVRAANSDSVSVEFLIDREI